MAEYIYKVKPGDTVLSVCLIYQMSYELFAELNPDFNICGHRYMDQLRIGERIILGNSSNIFDKLRVESIRRKQ